MASWRCRQHDPLKFATQVPGDGESCPREEKYSKLSTSNENVERYGQTRSSLDSEKRVPFEAIE